MRGLAVSLILLVTACGPDPSAGKAVDTDGVDTTDSADSGDTGETGDTKDSGDTGTGDSGDTGDTGDSGDSAAGDSGDSAAGDSGDSAAGDSGDSAAGDSGDSAAGDSGDSAAGDSGDSGDTGDSAPPLPLAACVLNADEPNDSRRDATDTLIYLDGEVFNGAGQIDGPLRDHDVFRADVPPSCNAKVTLRPNPLTAALGLDLRTSSGQSVFSRTSTGTIITNWYNDTAGYSTLLVDVYARTVVNTCTPYTVKVELNCSAPDPGVDLPDDSCFEIDPLEPNDTLGLAVPTGLTAAGQRYRASRVQLDAARNDLDRYRVSIPAGCFVDASIAFDNAAGNLDLAVVYPIDYSGGTLETALVPASAGTNDSERVLYRNGDSAPLTAYVVVFPGEPRACNDYDIDIRVRCNVPPPSPSVSYCSALDPTEWTGLVGIPGSNPPSVLVVSQPTGLLLDGDRYNRTGIAVDSAFLDQDVFTGTVPPGCTLTADLAFDATLGDLDVLARGFDGTDVFLTQSTNSGESFSYTRPIDQAAMNFYLLVGPADGVTTCNTFDLSLALSCPAP